MRARRPLHSLFLVAVAGLALGLAACGRGGDEATPEKNDRVVARVNDRAVWASDVRREAVAQGLIGEDDPLDASSELFRRVMDATRAIPEIVIALMLIYILGGGPVPAVAAIALHTAGALGKLFSEVAENADLKPVEGLTSVGASWGQRMWLGIIPQVAPNWLSYALMRFEINVRASAILGFVGSGGIGYDLKIAMQWGQGRYDEVVAIFLLLFVTIVAIDRLSDHARARLVKGRNA